MTVPAVNNIGTVDRLVEVIQELFQYWQEERRALEDVWYLSYDAFRGKYGSTGRYGSATLDKWKALEGHDWRSKLFVQLTRRRIISGAANIEDLLFQGGELPFNIEPTPVPESAPGMQMHKEIARQRAELMRTTMKDILVETKYERKLMGNVLEYLVYGVTCSKCPIVRPYSVQSYQMNLPMMPGGMQMPQQMQAQNAMFAMQSQARMLPSAEQPSIWQIYWDMEGKDFYTGRGVIDYQMLDAGQLRRLASKPGYDRKAIDEVIGQYAKRATEGNASADTTEGPHRTGLLTRGRDIPVIEWWGRVEKDDLIKGGHRHLLEPTGNEVEIFTVIAGDKIIRPPVINPFLRMGISRPEIVRPFHFAVWEPIPNEPNGIGMAEDLIDHQMMANGIMRSYLDNKALSGNIMMAYRGDAVEPGYDPMSIYTGKGMELMPHITDVRQAIQYFTPPDIGPGMLEAYDKVLQQAEEDSGMPRMLQGQTSKEDPKTAFATGKVFESANKMLGKGIRNLDEGIIEPDMSSMYYWLMMAHQDPNIKGDYRVKATGFQSFRDRFMKLQNTQTFFQFMMSHEILAMMTVAPEFARDIAQMLELDKERLIKTDKEIEAMVAELNKPPVIPPEAGGEA